MKRITWALSLLLAFGLCPALGQTTFSGMEFLQFNPDAVSAGMGNTTLGAKSKMHLYTDPTAFMLTEDRLSASYSVSFLPQNSNSRNGYHALSLGYKPGESWSLMGGFRLQKDLKVELFDETGLNYGSVEPVEWSLDLGGVWTFAPRWTGFITAGFIRSWQGQGANSFALGAGINFSEERFVYRLPFRYSATLSVSNVGGNLSYRQGGEDLKLPSAVNLGGSAELTVAEGHDLSIALLLSEELQSGMTDRTAFGVGVGYEALDMISLRTGWSYRYGMDSYTLGIGGKYRFVSLDLGYSFFEEKAFNQMRLSISLHI